MSIIPYEHFVINTSLSLTEVVSVISESLERNDKFIGSVNNNGFKIHRKIWYANASLPIIYGRFHPKERGAQVDIKVTLALSSIAFIIVWSALALYVLIRSIIEWNNTGGLSGSFIFGLVMLPFMYFIIMLGWVLESGAARRFITTMFSGQHVV